MRPPPAWPRSSTRSSGSAMSEGRGRCRFCGAPLACTFADLGMSPIANNYLTEDELSRCRAVLPAARARLRSVLPGPARGVRDAGEDLLRLRLLLLVLDELARALPRATPRWRPSGSRSERARRWSSWRATTATCSSTSSSAASPCWASSRPRTSPRSRSSAASRPRSPSSARRPPRASPADKRQADLLIGNNVLAHVPGPERLRRRDEGCCSRPPARSRWSSRTSSG